MATTPARADDVAHGDAEAAPGARPSSSRPSDGLSPAISVEGVRKVFDDNVVLDGVDLEVRRGEVYGLMGPSGCGKTTLVRMLVGLSLPTDGRIEVLGSDPASFGTRERGRLGYVPQGFFLYPTLSVWGNALFAGGLYGLGWLHRRRRAREVLQFLELWDARKRLTREISGGMQRRLLLACALMHQPDLLVVDEPTAGLDPLIRSKIWEHLHALRERGVTIMMTTQHLNEAEHCDRVAIMDAGHIIADGAPLELRSQAMRFDRIHIVGTEPFSRGDVAALWGLPDVERVDVAAPDELRVLAADSAEATAAISSALYERGTGIASISTELPDFDDIFVGLVDRR